MLNAEINANLIGINQVKEKSKFQTIIEHLKFRNVEVESGAKSHRSYLLQVFYTRSNENSETKAFPLLQSRFYDGMRVGVGV